MVGVVGQTRAPFAVIRTAAAERVSFRLASRLRSGFRRRRRRVARASSFVFRSPLVRVSASVPRSRRVSFLPRRVSRSLPALATSRPTRARAHTEPTFVAVRPVRACSRPVYNLTYRVKRFVLVGRVVAKGIPRRSATVSSQAARRARERKKTTVFVHLERRASKEASVAPRFSPILEVRNARVCIMCVCIHVIYVYAVAGAARAHAAYFSSPFWLRFTLGSVGVPPPVGHGKVQRLVTADAANRSPAPSALFTREAASRA